MFRGSNRSDKSYCRRECSDLANGYRINLSGYATYLDLVKISRLFRTVWIRLCIEGPAANRPWREYQLYCEVRFITVSRNRARLMPGLFKQVEEHKEEP